ncbi:MAG: hypothetical protein J1F03_06595, partial [Oscillospiraceae bacterium]|nr:hypothetical protein [Oscillospiraceae bacterium]
RNQWNLTQKGLAEKLEIVLECEKIEDYRVETPTRIYTYLLNDMAEEFKVKPLLLNVFSEEDEQELIKEADEDSGSEKKGFFKKLFGKK